MNALSTILTTENRQVHAQLHFVLNISRSATYMFVYFDRLYISDATMPTFLADDFAGELELDQHDKF